MQFVGYYVELYFLFQKRCQIVFLECNVLRCGIRFHILIKTVTGLSQTLSKWWSLFTSIVSLTCNPIFVLLTSFKSHIPTFVVELMEGNSALTL